MRFIFNKKPGELFYFSAIYYVYASSPWMYLFYHHIVLTVEYDARKSHLKTFLDGSLLDLAMIFLPTERPCSSLTLW